MSRCRAYSGAVDRALLEGRLSLPANINLECDAQEYTLNWTSRMDRRNIVLQSYATVDSKTRFILGMHGNFDGNATLIWSTRRRRDVVIWNCRRRFGNMPTTG